MAVIIAFLALCSYAAGATNISTSTEVSLHAEASGPEFTPVAIRATSIELSISKIKHSSGHHTSHLAVIPTTSSIPPIPVDCVNHPNKCPACEDHNLVFPFSGCDYRQPYTVACDRSLTNVETYARIHDPSGALCALLCDLLHAPNGCAGVLLRDGTCEVVTGCDFRNVEAEGTVLLRPAASPCSNGSELLPPPATCGNETALSSSGFCKACDRQTVKWGGFGNYYVKCDTTYTGVKLRPANEDVTTLSQCVLACDAASGCYAPVIASSGRCVLAFPEDSSLQGIGIEQRAGYAVLEPRFTGLLPPPPTTSSASHHLDASTSFSHHLEPPTSTSSRKHCVPTDISCPNCNDVYVTDVSNTTYHIFCDNDLYSSSGSAAPHVSSPLECLSICDGSKGCKGVTFDSHTEANACVLARGENVFPQSREGSTAFLSVNLSYTATELGISAYPGGELTSALRMTGLAGATPTPTPRECKVDGITCPRCKGVEVTVSGENYVARCNFHPICADVTFTSGYSSQQQCMSRCDEDTACLAAIWMDGRCNLCEGGGELEGLMAYRLPEDYVVFVNEARAGTKTGLITGTTSWKKTNMIGIGTKTLDGRTSLKSRASAMSLRSRTTVNPITSITHPSAISSISAAPTRTPSIKDVSCPSYDDFAVIDPTDKRHFYVLCDTGFIAASHRPASADNFAACAAKCTGECDGFEFAGSMHCELYTSISVIGDADAGVTAGVHILNPGPSMGGQPLTVTSTGVLPGISATIAAMAGATAGVGLQGN